MNTLFNTNLQERERERERLKLRQLRIFGVGNLISHFGTQLIF